MGAITNSNYITSITRGMMKAYAARSYTKKNPRYTDYVEVNVPEYTPTLPKDQDYSYVSVNRNYFVNSNYPITQDSVKVAHSLPIKLARGTSCPTIFPKGTEFLLFFPTGKIEEGYLIYL